MKEAKQYNAYSEDLQVLMQALPEKNQSPQIDSPLPRIHQIINMKETPATAVGKKHFGTHLHKNTRMSVRRKISSGFSVENEMSK